MYNHAKEYNSENRWEQFVKEVTMIPKAFDKYTNYSAYILVAYQGAACKVDETTLCKLIQRLVKKYKKPYIRFIWKNNTEDAMCALYDGAERKTKLITFNELNTEE